MKLAGLLFAYWFHNVNRKSNSSSKAASQQGNNSLTALALRSNCRLAHCLHFGPLGAVHGGDIITAAQEVSPICQIF